MAQLFQGEIRAFQGGAWGGYGLDDVQISDQGQKLVKQRNDIPPLLIANVKNFQSAGGVLTARRLKQRHNGLIFRHAQTLLHSPLVDDGVSRRAPVQQGNRVPHRAVTQPGQQQSGVLFQSQPLLAGDIQQPVGHGGRGNAAKIIALASGKDGGGHFVDFGGG